MNNKKIRILIILVLVIIIAIIVINIILKNYNEKNNLEINNSTNIFNAENSIESNETSINLNANNTDNQQEYDNIENVNYITAQISKLENDNIYLLDKDNKNYILYNASQKQYKNGRTAESLTLNDIKVGDYITKESDDKYLIFKNISGEELKKELLVSLSLSDNANIMRTSVDEIKDVKQLGNNEAIAIFTISDLVSSEYYPNVNDEEHTFDVVLKVNNDTKYNTNFNGISAYNAETLENAKNDPMYYIRINPSTLNKKYPEITEFDSYSN